MGDLRSSQAQARIATHLDSEARVAHCKASMASHVTHSTKLDTRPSSWPIRRERQQLAAQQQSQRLDQIESNLARLTDVIDLFLNKSIGIMDELTSSPISPPPGLKQHDNDLMHRIQRLEALLVCKPPTHLEPSIMKSSANSCQRKMQMSLRRSSLQ